jgi:hypothetical protein
MIQAHTYQLSVCLAIVFCLLFVLPAPDSLTAHGVIHQSSAFSDLDKTGLNVLAIKCDVDIGILWRILVELVFALREKAKGGDKFALMEGTSLNNCETSSE